MGAYIVWFPRARVLTLVPIVLIFVPVRLPAIVMLGLWFVLQIFTQSSSGIATLAHIGGFVFGMLVAFVLARARGLPATGPARRLAATPTLLRRRERGDELRRERAEIGGDERAAADREPAPRPRVPAMPDSTSANGTPSAAANAPSVDGRSPIITTGSP